MGLAMCSSRRLPLEENNFMEFSMPILFVLAEDGLLCGYYAVNQLPNAVQITKPNGAPSMDNIRNGSIIIPKSLKGIIYHSEKGTSFTFLGQNMLKTYRFFDRELWARSLTLVCPPWWSDSSFL